MAYFEAQAKQPIVELRRQRDTVFVVHARGERRKYVVENNNRAQRGTSAEWADQNKVRKMNKSPKDRVRDTLTDAKDLAWEAFDAPSEEAVMQLFRRLCDIEDMCELDDMPVPGAMATPADLDEGAPEHAGHTKH